MWYFDWHYSRGCCASRHSSATNFSPLQRQLGFQERQIVESSESGAGPQVIVSAAGWLTKTGLPYLTAISLEGPNLIVALFEWHESPSAAAFCTKHVIEYFKSHQNGYLSLLDCIQNTFFKLDEDLIHGVSIVDRGRSRASGSILHLNLHSGKVSLGSVGCSTIAFGRLVHGLAAQLTESEYLNVPWCEEDSSNVYLNLGSGSLRQNLGAVHLREYDLSVRDEHMILGNGGLWSLISADDSVLRSHFFVKATWDCRTEKGGIAKPHVASHLVHHARNRHEIRHRDHMDSTAIVLTFRWPATSLNQAFPTQKGTFLQSLREQLAPDLSTPSGRAKMQWRKICMLTVEFNRARRRALHSKWISVVHLALRDGKQRARVIEEAYWQKHQAVVRVTPSGKITDHRGKTLLPTTLMLEAKC